MPGEGAPPAGDAGAPPSRAVAIRRASSVEGDGQDVTAHCPRLFLTGPSAFGRTSKSNISVGR